MWVAILFFLSGASGLIYQILWLRQLGLVFGVTVYAASTVLGAFMAGLGVGSLLGGRQADRVPRPLVWFGIVEIGVGLTALATPAALAGLQQLYAVAHPSLGGSLWATTAARLVISFAVLIVPTALMGASLPLIVKATTARTDELSNRTGLLYGTNTAGAIAGSLFAGLLFIPALGLQGTYWVAATVNVLVGLIAIQAGRRWPARTPPAGAPAVMGVSDAPARDAGVPVRIRRLILVVFALSGVATLALEVIWFRVIALIVRPTVYSFALMLAAVLLGIAVGSWTVAPLLRRRWPWLTILASLEIGLGLATLLSLGALNHSPALFTRLEPWVTPWMQYNLAYTAIVAVPAVLPASLLMGMAFPIGVHLWAGGAPDAVGRAGRNLGLFYALNVGGAIVGSLVAGFLLLPLAGSRLSLIFVAALIYASGLALWLCTRHPRLLRGVAALALISVFGVLADGISDPFDAYLRARFPGDDVLWRKESVQSTISVHRQGEHLTLQVEGNHQASDNPSTVAVHRRIGHLPMVLHPEPREALVIGLGGGATAGAVSVHDHVAVDVVELSGAVVEAARFFSHINYDIHNRANVRLLVDDGRNHLALGRHQYDVITADIILPHHAGANNLYSEEYFRLVSRSLKPRGLFLQWIAGTEAEYKAIARTFMRVFPHGTAWIDGGLFVGSNEPLRLNERAFEWKTRMPGYDIAFDNLGIRAFADLLSLYTAGPGEIGEFLGDGPTLSDDRPLIEYFLLLPRDRFADLSQLRGDVRRHVD